MRSLRWFESILTSGAASDSTWILLSGASMEPTYADGDWLLVEPVTRSVRPGEVVVARRGGRLVTHRVVSLRNGQVVTRGDACAIADPPIAMGGVIGRVIGVRRRSGLGRSSRRLLRRVRRILRTTIRRER